MPPENGSSFAILNIRLKADACFFLLKATTQCDAELLIAEDSSLHACEHRHTVVPKKQSTQAPQNTLD